MVQESVNGVGNGCRAVDHDVSTASLAVKRCSTHSEYNYLRSITHTPRKTVSRH